MWEENNFRKIHILIGNTFIKQNDDDDHHDDNNNNNNNNNNNTIKMIIIVAVIKIRIIIIIKQINAFSKRKLKILDQQIKGV